MKHNLFRAAALAVLLLPGAAWASNKVSSPDITDGKTELEYRLGHDTDDDTAARNRQQTHKFVANHAFTPRWRMEGKAVASGRVGDLDWTYLEWSNRWQVWKEKEGPVKLALQATYKLAVQSALPDKIEFTVLAARDTGPLSHTLNLNAENEIGDRAAGGTDINLGWKTKYRLMPALDPGVEFYADFGKVGSRQPSMADKYQIGPTLSGEILPGLKYDTGLLFGLSRAVPDERFKLILTHAF
jgi:hypothetical protein